eukprot:1499532-Rhodomonas_salina.1
MCGGRSSSSPWGKVPYASLDSSGAAEMLLISALGIDESAIVPKLPLPHYLEKISTEKIRWLQSDGAGGRRGGQQGKETKE